MKNLKIGIVGHGFVGQAVDYGFSVNVEKKIIDPKYNSAIQDLVGFDPDVIFICVPTPMSDSGAIDCSIILDVISEISDKKINAIIVVKSSITPSKLKDCASIISHLVYNPEFLTERNANYDFINPQILVIGGSKSDCEYIKKIHDENSVCNECPVFFTDVYTASLVKYTLNSFLATKVLFMNEIYKIFHATDTSSNWDDFTNILQADPRMGTSHLKVPGPDGKLGFGGACFPKDIAAIIAEAKEANEDLELMNAVKSINNNIRSSYSDLDKREKDQNVNFDG
jgi:UDPglucose 6-dehydrogenase